MAHIADTLIDRLLRHPTGPVARRWWRDTKGHHRIFRETLRYLDLQPTDRLIEIGCGGGTFMSWALQSGCSGTAIDHSADMAELTRRNNATAVADGRLDIVCAPGDHLPLPDGGHTCAVLMNVLFFLDAPVVLGELRRTVSHGGYLIVHTPAPYPPTAVAPAPLARRMRLYSDDELVTLVEAAGFENVRIDHLDDGVFQLVTASTPAQ